MINKISEICKEFSSLPANVRSKPAILKVYEDELRKVIGAGIKVTCKALTKVFKEDVLIFIRDNPASTTSDIAKRFGISKHSAYQHAHNLHKCGKVVSQRNRKGASYQYFAS